MGEHRTFRPKDAAAAHPAAASTRLENDMDHELITRETCDEWRKVSPDRPPCNEQHADDDDAPAGAGDDVEAYRG
jgi:hypothetical protein